MKIDRLIAIIMILLEKKKVSAPELADMFEVNLRTIYRDIETINQSGIPIVTYRGPNGGISIMENYKIEKKLFSLSDITELLIGLNSIYSTLSSQEILNVMAKLKGLMPPEEIQMVEEKVNQVKVDHTPWHGNENVKQRLEKIKFAMHHHKLISFTYFDRLKQKSERKIEPYRLVLKNSNWYVQGYCLLRKDFRIFEVTNMSSFQVLEESFEARDFDYKAMDIYFTTERKRILLKLIIQESLLEIMIEKCGKDNVHSIEKGRYIAYFPFVEDDYFYNMLISYGNQCECVEPIHVREEIVNRLEKILGVYKNV